MDILNNEAEGENTLFSLAELRRVSNEDLIRNFLERRKLINIIYLKFTNELFADITLESLKLHL
jgi:hypothetical protein